MDFKVLWRSDPTVNKMGSYAHIVELEGDRILEVYLPREPFWDRLVRGVRYIIKGNTEVFSSVILDRSFEAVICEGVCKNVIKDR